MSLLFSALCAKCPYYLVLRMLRMGGFQAAVPFLVWVHTPAVLRPCACACAATPPRCRGACSPHARVSACCEPRGAREQCHVAVKVAARGLHCRFVEARLLSLHAGRFQGGEMVPVREDVTARGLHGRTCLPGWLEVRRGLRSSPRYRTPHEESRPVWFC